MSDTLCTSSGASNAAAFIGELTAAFIGELTAAFIGELAAAFIGELAAALKSATKSEAKDSVSL